MNQSANEITEKIKQEMIKTLNALLAQHRVVVNNVDSNIINPLVTILDIIQKNAAQCITQDNVKQLITQLETLTYTNAKNTLNQQHPVVEIMKMLAEANSIPEAAPAIINLQANKLVPIMKALQFLKDNQKLTHENVSLLQQNLDQATAIAELICCIDAVGALQPTVRGALMEKVKGTEFLNAHAVAIRLKEMQLLSETTVLKLLAATDWNPKGFHALLQQLEQIDPTLYQKDNIEVLVKVAISSNVSATLLNAVITALSDLNKNKSLNPVTRAMLIEHPDRAHELVQSPAVKEYMNFRGTAPQKLQPGVTKSQSFH